MQRHVNLFFSTIPSLTGKISASITAGDRESLRIAAHSIKSPLRAAGVQKAVELAEYLEAQAQGEMALAELLPVSAELEKVCKAAMEELKQKMETSATNP
jgi:HPt (histidine-containing phosphotransfer) domain-containing protein